MRPWSLLRRRVCGWRGVVCAVFAPFVLIHLLWAVGIRAAANHFLPVRPAAQHDRANRHETRRLPPPSRSPSNLWPRLGRALLGSLAGHAAAGMSRGDLKELGEHLDGGQAGLIVVAVSDMQSKVEQALKQAENVEKKELKADQNAIEADAQEAAAA